MGCTWPIGAAHVAVGIFCCSGADDDCCASGGPSGNEGVFKGGDVCDDGEGSRRAGKQAIDCDGNDGGICPC